MREIIFRGKRVDNGEWVEGYLLRTKFYLDDSEHSLIFTDVVEFPRSEFGGANEVIPETVGQYIGLKDQNGKLIFEGDLLQWCDVRDKKYWGKPCVVKYGEFNCSCCNGVYGWYLDDGDIRNIEDYVVVGNIHDNAELLGEEHE